MEWYQYLAVFFAGVFFANAVPHFIHGISGNKFPTPFSNPRGVGLSSTTNVVLALVNIAAGYILFIISKTNQKDYLLVLTFFAGISAISIFSSIIFGNKHKE